MYLEILFLAKAYKKEEVSTHTYFIATKNICHKAYVFCLTYVRKP